MNANGILAGEEVTIDTRRKPLGNTGGSVLAQAAMQISCGLLENNGGRLQAGGNLRIDTRGQPLHNRYTGNTGIQCGADLFLDAGEVDNMAGMISAAGTTQIDGGALKNSEGKLTTAQSMKLMTRSLENQGEVCRPVRCSLSLPARWIIAPAASSPPERPISKAGSLIIAGDVCRREAI
ncbi:hypothetical protein SODG_002229 [Sodalis praecaptivus]